MLLLGVSERSHPVVRSRLIGASQLSALCVVGAFWEGVFSGLLLPVF